MADKKLTVYFTSDLHGYIYPTDYRSRDERDIGLFKCASRFEKDGNTLVIDGGDLLQGSPLGAFCHDTIGDGRAFAGIMNRCGYDYVTLGNHDFNFGTDYLGSYLGNLNARCVCENVSAKNGCAPLYPARVHTLENGLRVGIVGIVTDYVNIWERPEHIASIRISDPIPAAAAALEKLKSISDVTLCVYHGGFERDLATGRVLSATHENVAYRICQELDFDILLTGHQHMSVPGQTLFGTFVVQPSDRGQEFIRVGGKEVSSRAYLSKFNFAGADQEKLCGVLSGGERNRLHLALTLKAEANVLLLDEPTNDIDVNTLRALEEGLENFAGCAVVVSHDRWFLDRICTHILSFEGDSNVVFYEGSYSEYEEYKRKLLGDVEPKRVRYRKLIVD